MENLIDELQFILETDRTIRELVASEEDEVNGVSYPSIAQEEAPEGMAMPYIVIRVESDLPDGELMNRAILNFDVFGENNKRDIERLARRVEQLFDRCKLMPYGVISHREGIYPIESEDPSLIGRNVKILVRYPREDLIDSEVHTANETVVYVKVNK